MGQVSIHYHKKSFACATQAVEKTEFAITASDLGGNESVGDGSHQIAKAASNDWTEKESDLTNTLDEGGKLQERSAHSSRTVLYSEAFLHSNQSGSRPEEFRVRSTSNVLVLLLGVVSIALLVAGSILPAFSNDVFGILAELSVQTNDAGTLFTDISVISLAQLLVGDIGPLNHGTMTTVGHWLLSFVLVGTVTVTPILCVCGLLVQWFCPLTAQSRKKVELATGACHTYQNTEAFCLAAIAVSCMFQLTEISMLLMGRHCQGLGAIIELAVDAGLLESEGLQCYVVNSSMEMGFLLLIAGCFCVFVLHNFVTSGSKQWKASTEARPPTSSSKPIGATSSFTDEDLQEKIDMIAAPSAVFSDRFRWFLVSDQSYYNL